MAVLANQRNEPRHRSRRGRDRPHWSYSQLATYLRCPLRYYFDYIVKLPRPFTPSSLAFGSAIHEALAEYHRHLMDKSNVSTRQIEDAFLLSWKEKCEERPIRFRKNESSAELVDQGVTLLNKYLEKAPPENIVGVEQEMTVPLVDSEGNVLEKPLLAFIDLLCGNDDELTVIEFKTSGRRYSDSEVETALQATCYYHAVQERFDGDVQIHYRILLKTKTPQIQDLATSRTAQDVARLGDMFRSVERAVEASVFYPVESPMNCSTCPHRKPCREWTGSSRSTVAPLFHQATAEVATC